MSASGKVAGDHGDDGLRQSTAEVVALNHQGGTALRRA
jgi:hypothetical protein